MNNIYQSVKTVMISEHHDKYGTVIDFLLQLYFQCNHGNMMHMMNSNFFPQEFKTYVCLVIINKANDRPTIILINVKLQGSSYFSMP